MSESPGIDQNGVVVEDVSTAENAKVELFQYPSIKLSPLDTSKNTMEDTDQLSDTDTQADTSLNKKHSLERKSQSSESLLNENQASKEKINKPTNENDDTTVKTEQEEAANQSRELKSLLALSKEAKLETNLSRKRKSLNQKKKAKSESRSSTGKIPKIQYPVTAESELEMELQSTEGNKHENKEEESTAGGTTPKAAKRKKISLSDTSGDGVTDETPKKSRKSLTTEVTMFKPNKDMFCWRCHKDGVNISCETCPRSYHHRCLKQTINDPNHWPCPECVSILKAESTQTRSPAMKGMTLEHLCSLLKFAVKRMIQCQGSEPFIHAVNDVEFPDYKKYIIQPMDLTLLEKNIKENLYGSTQAFEADAKWILHNSIIFNSYQSKLTSVAKSIIKICKQEMAEIENCPTCYLNANTKKKTWFVEVCPKPHLLVWAKLRGFPFWPGKAMSCRDGTVDVRFFGAHDRAWVPEKECFLYSPKDPNGFRVKRADIEQCVEELNVHVENLKKIYGEFNYPPFKTPLDPDNEMKQLQTFLPRYKSYFNKHKFAKKQSTDGDKTESKQREAINEIRQEKPKEVKKKEEIYNNDDETMEGYGTDDETMPEIDTEMRKTLLKKSENESNIEDHEAEEDDTQVPTNVEPDTSGIEEFILTKAARKSFLAESVSTTKLSGSEPSSKRQSFDESSPLPIKLFRRNSETKSDSTRISDKISRIDISENMEISLGNDDKGSVSYSDNISSSNSECSSDFSIEIKKKPVQVDVDNAEFTISPASKLKMADKLMKRLSDGDGTSGESSASSSHFSEKLEQAKTNLNKEKLNQTVNLKEKVEDVQPIKENVVESEPSFPLLHSGFEDLVSSTNIFDNREISSNEAGKEIGSVEATSEASVQNAPVSESKELSVTKTDDVAPETTTEVSEKEREAEEVIINFPDEIVHEDLHINDTKQEIDKSDTDLHHDMGDANDDEDSESSDETSADENKPLSVLAKDVSHKVKDGKNSYVEAIPRLRIVLKAVRTEEKLDQLMKRSLEEDTLPAKQKEIEGLKSPARKSNETFDESEAEQLEEVDSEELSKASNSEFNQNTDNKSPENHTKTFKVHSPEKGGNILIIRSMQEETKGTLHKEQKLKQAEEKSKSPINDKDYSSRSQGNKTMEASNILNSRDENECDNCPPKATESQKKVNNLKDVEDEEAMDTDTFDEVDLNIDKAKIINIIHSALNDTSTTPEVTANGNQEFISSETIAKSIPPAIESKKRKLSLEDNGESLKSQSKMLKLVSIESIMNKANNNQEDNQEKEENNSILKTSLEAKKIVRISSVQNSPNSSTRSSVHEVLNEEIKSEPESEAESNTGQDLEAKKKYLSALNILEKGEADAQKPKTNEIRTRSKTEEKRERFRVSSNLQVVDNMTKIIEDVAVNYSAVHEGEALPPPKKKPPSLINSKPDGCEIYVKSFAKIVPETPEDNNTIIPVAPTKQRARKSFPQPNYSKPMIKPSLAQPSVSKEMPNMTPSIPSAAPGTESIIKVTAKTTMAITSPIAMSAMATLTPQQTPKASVPPLQSIEGVRPTNGYLILQPPQQENLLLLPPNQTINYTSTIQSQMLSMITKNVVSEASKFQDISVSIIDKQVCKKYLISGIYRLWLRGVRMGECSVAGGNGGHTLRDAVRSRGTQGVYHTPCLVSAPTHNPILRHITSTPQIWYPGQAAKDPTTKEPNVTQSQNYIPQGEGGKGNQISGSGKNTASSGSKKLVNGLPETPLVSTTVEVLANATPTSSALSSSIERPEEGASVTVPERPQPVEPEVVIENGESDEFGILNSLIPENVSRAVSEIIRRPPPKLKPRPPGILSQQFSEGTPSSAGPVTAKINSVAHRLGDYLRGMLIETLGDLGKTNNAEGTITNLKFEVETLKHKHSIELSEIEKNMCTILKDIQQSIVEDRERVIEETRAACEVESIKRVEEAKSKQWCANCSKEAQFYCCWNTSYCDYPCQQKHWPNHMSKCTQNINQPAQITPASAIRPGSQQLILRPANPPAKGGLGRVFSKPIQKVYMNRNLTAPKTMRVQTSTGNLLTMMETTPGNYQLMSSNPIVRTSNSLSNIKTTNFISVSSPGNTSINTSSPQKNIATKPVRVLNHPVPVSTVLEEDSD